MVRNSSGGDSSSVRAVTSLSPHRDSLPAHTLPPIACTNHLLRLGSMGPDSSARIFFNALWIVLGWGFRRYSCIYAVLHAKKEKFDLAQWIRRASCCRPAKKTGACRQAPVRCQLFTRKNYAMILATTPAPTVRPPSRIAKRRPSSMATGLIRVAMKLMLSPGITISTPSFSSTAPVTSVVRK